MKEDIFGYDLDAVEPQKDFTIAVAGRYKMVLDEIEVTEPELRKGGTGILANLRYSFVDPTTVTKESDGILGSVFNKLWLHSPKGYGFVRAFVEAHGGNWTEFVQQFRAGVRQDPIAYITQLLRQYKGTQVEVNLKVVREDQNGEDLANPRNEIARYVVGKTVNS